MSFNELLPIILLIGFTSTVRSAIGFGDALIAMPILTFMIGAQAAAASVALVSTTIAVVIFVRNWRKANFKDAWRLIVGAAIGIPIGIYLLTQAPESLILTIIGVVLIAYGVYNLLVPNLPYLKTERWGLAFGIVAGMLGGAFNTKGPAVIIYGALRRWDASEMRITLQTFFVPTSIFLALGHAVSGLWTEQVAQLYLFMLPSAIFGIWIGGFINERIDKERFSTIIFIALIIIGLSMVLNAAPQLVQSIQID